MSALDHCYREIRAAQKRASVCLSCAKGKSPVEFKITALYIGRSYLHHIKKEKDANHHFGWSIDAATGEHKTTLFGIRVYEVLVDGDYFHAV